nr:uncharacterized protein LOC133607254 [Nerophis lumbriciformis]
MPGKPKRIVIVCRERLQNGTPETADMYRQTKQCAALAVAEANTRTWEEFRESMESDFQTASKRFWITIRHLRRGKQCTVNNVYGGDGALGVHISNDFSWTVNTTSIIKKAQQRLHFLRVLGKYNLKPDLLLTFYRSSIESLLTYCITVWYGSCTAADRERLQRVVKTAQKIIGRPLPSLTDIYTSRCLNRASAIIKDSTHPGSDLFHLLPSGKRYRVAGKAMSKLSTILGGGASLGCTTGHLYTRKTNEEAPQTHSISLKSWRSVGLWSLWAPTVEQPVAEPQDSKDY